MNIPIMDLPKVSQRFPSTSQCLAKSFPKWQEGMSCPVSSFFEDFELPPESQPADIKNLMKAGVASG